METVTGVSAQRRTRPSWHGSQTTLRTRTTGRTTKKRLVLLVGSMLVLNSTMGSALPSMAVPDMAVEFGVGSPGQRALPISVFLVGYVLGPVVWGPLSEHVGRRRPSIAAFGPLLAPVGACLAMPVFCAWDAVVARASRRGAPWARRLALACCGGPLFVVSLLWLGFAARPSVPVAAPMLAGFPFGAGFVLIFMALLNNLTDAYDIFAASTNAAASCSRSLLAVVLPLATAPMFAALGIGISGACALLAGLSAAMCVIPFVFICKGPAIRSRSPFCIALHERGALSHFAMEAAK